MTELAMLSLLQQSHSVLNPSSPQTRLIDRLWDAMYLVSAVVFVLVVLALLLCRVPPPRRRSRRRPNPGGTDR